MAENPYIAKIELAAVGISATSIMRNIEYMRNKYLRRVGPDNGGFWESHRPRCCTQAQPNENFGWACFI